MTRIFLGVLLVAGCKGPGDDDTDDTDSEPGFSSLLLDAAPETGMLLGAWSDGDEAIIVGGDFAGIGRITRYNGERFCVEATEYPAVLWWVHGRSEGDWYAVGENGTVVHESAGARTRDDIPTTYTLFGVYDDGTDVWAVGGDVRNTQQGEIWRKPAGGAWELVLGEINGVMFKAWNGWFVGDGKAYWWDGSQLVERHPPNDAKLLTVSGTEDQVWAVGGVATPVLLEWGGTDWIDHPVAPACAGNQGLNGVWTDGTDVLTAGFNGAAGLFDGDWNCDIPPLTQDHFHVAWKHGEQNLWMGGDFFSFGDNHGTVNVHPPVSGGPLTVETCN